MNVWMYDYDKRQTNDSIDSNNLQTRFIKWENKEIKEKRKKNKEKNKKKRKKRNIKYWILNIEYMMFV